MKTIGNFAFPETRDEVECWEPAVRVHWLARDVIAVAKARVEGAWACYIRAAPSIYNEQRSNVAALYDGDKQPENIARAIFPEFEGVPYAR